MSYDIGPRLGIEGEAAFKQSIAAVNAQLKSMGAEMKAVVSAYDDGDRSTQKLAAQSEVLGRSIDATKQKIGVLQDQYTKQRDKLTELGAALEKASREYGENSQEALKAQNAYNRQAAAVGKLGADLNNATADLNRMERELENSRKAMDGMDDSLDEVGDGLDSAGQRASSFGDMLKANLTAQAIIGGVKALGSAIADVAGTLKDSVVNAAYAADDLNTMSKQYGLSTAELQKFQFATEQIDVPLETLTGSMSKMTKNMATASKGTGDACNAFKALGVEVKNQDGSLRDRNQVFQEAIDALGRMENETQRDAYAMQIFGKSAQDLNPLILGGADALKDLGDQAQEAGLILSQDTLDELNLVSDAIDTFKATSSAAGNLFSAAFAQPVAGAVNAVTGYIQQLTRAYSEGGFQALASELGRVLSEIASQITNALPGIVDTGTKIALSLVRGFVQMLPQIAQAAVTIITQFVSSIGETLPTLLPAVVEAVMVIVNGLISSIPLFINAALQMLQGLAQGIIAAIPVLLEALPELYQGLYDGLLAGIPQIITAGTELLTSIVDALPEIIATVVAVLPEMIDAIVSALLDNLPLIVDAGVGLLTALVEDLPTIISAVTGALPELISGIVDTLMDSLPALIETGVELLTSLIDNLPAIITGIASAIPTLVTGIASAITGNIDKIILAGVQLLVALISNLPEIIAGVVTVVPQIVAGIVDAFGALAGDIADIGADLLRGIWEGIKNTGDWLWNQVKGFFGGILDNIKAFLGIHSPSRVFAEFGVMSMKGFAVGMKDESGNTIKTAADLSKAILKAATDWVSEQKGYDQLTAKQEAEFWEELKSIAGLGAKELKEIDQKLYAARKNASKEAFNYSKGWIEEEKFYNRLSAQEEVEAWERVASRKNLLAAEQAQAERSLYTARQNLAKEQNDLLKKQADEEEKLYQKQIKAVEEYEKALESRTESLRSFTGLFDEIKQDADVSGTELLKNLRGQVSAFQRWQSDIEALTERGVTGPLLEELQELGPKAADQIHALTTLTDRQLDEYITLFTEKGRLAAEQAESEIPPVEIPLKVAEGEEGAEGTAVDTMTTFQTAIQNSLKDVTATGETVVHTLEEAMRGTGGAIVDAAKELISRFCYTFESRYSSFRNTGLNAMAGLSAGLWAGGQEAIATARDIADSIIAEMDRALGIHSPSTVMAEMGGYMAQGLELGFTRSMEGVKSNMTKSMTPETPALKAAEGTVNGILGGLPALIAQMGGGEVHIHVDLNGREIAGAVFDHLQDIAKQRGVKLG